MGVAQYNRGTKAIQVDIDRTERPAEFAFMDDLNAVPKTANAHRPFGDVHFVPGHRGWWAECPVTGYGFWFPALRTAVAAFRVEVYARKGAAWIARPAGNVERRHHYQHLPAFALASVHEMGKGRDMSNPNDPMYPGRTHAGMTIRQSFVMEAMGKLAAKFTEYERTDSGTRVCPENFETRSKEVAKIACLYADAALAEEARTRKQS